MSQKTWTVSLCLDLNGVAAKSGHDAVRVAKEALEMGIPILASSIDYGAVAHACPDEGKVEEIEMKRLK